MSDRDRESQLDRDGDRCPASEVFPVLAVGYIQTLHLSGKSLSSVVSHRNWRSIGELAQGTKCPDSGQVS